MKECKHEWIPLGNDRWSCKNCAMVKVGYVEELKEENRVLKKAFRNLIEEYLTVMNYINGDSLKVTKKEIDEDFDDRIQQAKENK